MGKTADLTVVQKTIIDTLHKEGKPQTFIAKEAGCSQSAVKSSQFTFIYIALLTIQIVSKHLTVSNWRIECQ